MGNVLKIIYDKTINTKVLDIKDIEKNFRTISDK